MTFWLWVSSFNQWTRAPANWFLLSYHHPSLSSARSAMLSLPFILHPGQLIIFFLYCRPRSINIGHIFSFGKVSSHGPGFKNPWKKNIYAMERFSHSNFYLFLHFWITFKCEQMLRTDIIKDLMNLGWSCKLKQNVF